MRQVEGGRQRVVLGLSFWLDVAAALALVAGRLAKAKACMILEAK